MKKTFLIFAMGFIPAVALLSNTYAQHSSVRTLLIRDVKNLLSIPVTDTAATSTANFTDASSSGINVKAIKSFDKTFKGVSNVSWYTIADGFGATFTQNENLNRAYYDKKGNLTFTISYYNGKKLPHDVRAMVKSTYYDCEIPFVEEIRKGDHVVYIVHLEDETTWKKVKVSDSGMELMEDLNKN
jgi:hypothetical protein